MEMKGWIDYQKFAANEAFCVGSYYNITNEPEENGKLFVSSFTNEGPFKREEKQEKQKIGFIK